MRVQVKFWEEFLGKSLTAALCTELLCLSSRRAWERGRKDGLLPALPAQQGAKVSEICCTRFGAARKGGNCPKVCVGRCSHLPPHSPAASSCTRRPLFWGRMGPGASRWPPGTGTVCSTWGLLHQTLALQKGWSRLGKEFGEMSGRVWQSKILTERN